MVQKSKRLTAKGRFWNKHIQRWQGINSTQTQYCNKHSLSIAAFRWWRRRLKKMTIQEKQPSEQVNSVTPFAELPVPIRIATSSNVYDYEIGLSNQTRLRLSNDCDPQMVATLLALLEATC
jgi:hypothetical protein